MYCVVRLSRGRLNRGSRARHSGHRNSKVWLSWVFRWMIIGLLPVDVDVASRVSTSQYSRSLRIMSAVLSRPNRAIGNESQFRVERIVSTFPHDPPAHRFIVRSSASEMRRSMATNPAPATTPERSDGMWSAWRSDRGEWLRSIVCVWFSTQANTIEVIGFISCRSLLVFTHSVSIVANLRQSGREVVPLQIKHT